MMHEAVNDCNDGEFRLQKQRMRHTRHYVEYVYVQYRWGVQLSF